jgi:hypothetical protein
MAIKDYKDEIRNEADTYYRQYINPNYNGLAHNDDYDAFRHAYTSGRVKQQTFDPVSEYFGNDNEINVPVKYRNSPQEYRMDLWNNKDSFEKYLKKIMGLILLNIAIGTIALASDNNYFYSSNSLYKILNKYDVDNLTYTCIVKNIKNTKTIWTKKFANTRCNDAKLFNDDIMIVGSNGNKRTKGGFINKFWMVKLTVNNRIIWHYSKSFGNINDFIKILKNKNIVVGHFKTHKGSYDDKTLVVNLNTENGKIISKNIYNGFPKINNNLIHIKYFQIINADTLFNNAKDKNNGLH